MILGTGDTGTKNGTNAAAFVPFFQPVKKSSRNSELFGIMGKKRRGGEKNGTVATG